MRIKISKYIIKYARLNLVHLCFLFVSCGQLNQVKIDPVYLFSEDIDTASPSFDPAHISFIPDYDRIQMVHSIDPLIHPFTNFDSLRLIYDMVNAVDFIAEQSKQVDILILNESHHYPSHRNFARHLLEGLKANGYKYLGLEALTSTTDFVQPEFPHSQLGYYCVEPTFAHFIRTAIALDFILFPYEYSAESATEREIGQAQNISNFLDQHSDGKAFIYCGYGHNYEMELPACGKTMVENLKELTGSDPLTINQVVFNHVNEIQGNSAVILVNNTSSYQPYAFNDLFIFHPNYIYSDNRISWKDSEETTWLKVDFLKKEIDYPILVAVYFNEVELKKGIPFDIVELKNQDEIEWLSVPKSEPYVIVIKNKSGQVSRWSRP